MKSRPLADIAQSESGTVLLVVMMMLLALWVLGMTTMFLAGEAQDGTMRYRQADEARYIAEAGLNMAMDFARNNPDAIFDQYKTVGYDSTSPNADVILKDASGNALGLGGSGATVAFALEQSLNELQSPVECGLPGYSERFGSLRVKVSARGFSGSGFYREVEAHAQLPPQEGLCEGARVLGGYAGGQ